MQATGGVAQTPYGPVQVRVTVAAGHISQVTVLQHPTGNSRSDQIAAYALPRLTAEALAADSADIDMVSGASYTSAGYKESLQSALDQVR